MSVILEITGSLETTEQFVLRDGEVAIVGRSPWADLSLPASNDIAEEHFEIDCRSAPCCVRAKNGPLLRNQVKVDEAVLEDGDLLRAGSIDFHVRLRGLTLASRQTASQNRVNRASELDDAFSGCLLRSGLSTEAQRHVQADAYGQTYDALTGAGLTKDACRFAIAAMSPDEAVTLALPVLGTACKLTADDRVRLLEYVSGERRSTAAEDIDQRIQGLSPRSPDAWLWKSARWLQTSMSPAGMPVVHPSPELFAVAMSVALALAAAQGPKGLLEQWMSLARERLLQKDGALHREIETGTRASA